LKLLLDTHVVVWWYSDDAALPAAWAKLLTEAESRGERMGVAAISLWEIAMLADRGRLRLTTAVDAMLEEIESHPSLAVLPLTARIAAESLRLGSAFPRDPADRLIAATARSHGLRLVTADARIRDSGVVAVV
jgi:PIN domain nuclease of toxin-antitoxin system